MSDPTDTAWRVVRAILRPLVRLCVRHAFPLQEFIDAAKVEYVAAATNELKENAQKINNSRISVMTGVHRRDVADIRELGEEEKPRNRPLSTLLQVVQRWEDDPEFQTRRGRPRVLSIKGPESEFRKLVLSVTRHVDPGTILFELKRAGAAQTSERGVRLVEGILRVGEDVEFGYSILAADIERLIASVEENLAIPRISNVHISTSYENIFVHDLPKIRRWLLEESKAFHRKLRKFLAQHDADETTDVGSRRGAGGSVSFCSFSTTSELPVEIDDRYLRPDQRSTAAAGENGKETPQ